MTHETIEEARDATLHDLSALKSRDERLRYILRAGRTAPRLADRERTADAMLDGCTAATWLQVGQEAERFRFRGDSEAVMVRGLMAILFRVYDNRTRDEISAVPTSFLKEAGILSTLSANRRNGITHLCQRIEGPEPK